MKRAIHRIIAISLVLAFSLLPTRAFPRNGTENQTEEPSAVKRLAGLGKLWGMVKYFHPALAYRSDIDWDNALISAIPKVRAAKNQTEYQEALQSLLDVVNDPDLRVIKKGGAPQPASEPASMSVEIQKTDTGNIIVIKTGNYFMLMTPENRKKLANLLPEMPKAKAIVFDLRSMSPTSSFARRQLIEAFSGLERFISTTPVSSPGERSRIHYGFEPQSGLSSGGYSSGFYIRDGKTIRPVGTGKDVPCVFLINENSGLLVSTQGLQARGQALIVFEGYERDVTALSIVTLPLSDGLSVRMRAYEMINGDGSSGEIQPDIVVSTSQDNKDIALETALDLARDFRPSTVTRKTLPSRGSLMRELTYPDMQYPSLEYRLLAIFRIWNTFNEFFPYKDLMDKKWEDTLAEFIPKFEQAKDSREYVLAITEMLTRTNDSHVRASGASVREVFGEGAIPVQIRVIENMPVVFRYVDEAAAKASGIELGDVILKVDGQDARSRLDWYAKYTTGSNESSRMFFAANTFTRGSENSTVTLTVRKRSGVAKEIKVIRRIEFQFQGKERRGDISKFLAPDIGYIDLDRLTVQQLPEVMVKFKNTKAIVLDMRGYPNGIAWALAPLFTEKDSIAAAFFERPIISLLGRTYEAFYQPIPPRENGVEIYKGKTVMLTDERTISQAEHTGLFLRAANGTKFIGSQTAGAIGDVTSFFVPGGIQIAFTGQSVKFPDGKQLQRIGLVPDIEAKPTIKGVQNGEDEVLERAIRYLRDAVRYHNVSDKMKSELNYVIYKEN